jgi:hypothetical protein
VTELRETLAKGGLAGLPVVEATLQGQRLTASRRPDGRWDLRGEADLLVVAEVGNNQKKAITGATPPAPSPAVCRQVHRPRRRSPARSRRQGPDVEARRASWHAPRLGTLTLSPVEERWTK